MGKSAIGTISNDLILSGQTAEDIPFFDGTNWVAQGGTEKIVIVTFTRDQSLASGTQIISGLGFKPSAIHFIAGQNSTSKFSSGHDDGTSVACWHNQNAGTNWERDFGNSIRVHQTSSDIYRGSVTTFDVDGFTINWTKTGSPTGTMEITALCFR